MKKLRRNIRRYSPRAALAAPGLKINSSKLLGPVKQEAVILQKSIWHTPAQKLPDAFIAMTRGPTEALLFGAKVGYVLVEQVYLISP